MNVAQLISDQRMLEVTHPAFVAGASHKPGDRIHRAVYEDGTAIEFRGIAGGNAKIWANEYSVRFLGGVCLVNVVWEKRF
jgi:hypothetical protein